MAEYISRDAAKKPFEYGAEYWQDWNIVAELDAIPAADVVEVVLCKDCQHAWGEGHACGKWNALVEPDDFCSAAKVAKTT